MSTAAQILANRQNSQLSTGPRTEAGKAASAQNALRHGATARTVVLAWENKEEFENLQREYYERFQPDGILEVTLLEDIISAQWRMRRMELVIAAFIDRAAAEHPSTDPIGALNDVMLSPEVAKLQRYENTFRRAFASAWKKLEALQKERKNSESENEAISPRPPAPILRNEPKTAARHPALAPSEPASDPVSPSGS
jgi:hypothetical protein